MRPHTTDFPQKVASWKGNPRLFQGNIGWVKYYHRWWFQKKNIFTPTWGNDSIWRAYFSNGLVQPPTSYTLARYVSWLKKTPTQPSKVIYIDVFLQKTAGLCGKPCDVDGGAPNRQGSPVLNGWRLKGGGTLWEKKVFFWRKRRHETLKNTPSN